MMHSDTMFPLFLIGYRCTGKTTIGKLLAETLDRPFIDTDAELESQFNISIAQMVESKGWGYFRACETQVLTSLDLSDAPVVATGGGIILADKNRAWIEKHGFAVWLSADAPTLVARIHKDAEQTDHRPDLTDNSLEDETIKMLEIRTPLYQKMARATIDTARHTPEAAAGQIIRRIEDERI